VADMNVVAAEKKGNPLQEVKELQDYQ